MAESPSVTGFLVRENKGWVFVTRDEASPELIDAIRHGWAKVSDLPIVIFTNSELFVPKGSDGQSITVREVTLA